VRRRKKTTDEESKVRRRASREIRWRTRPPTRLPPLTDSARPRQSRLRLLIVEFKIIMLPPTSARPRQEPRLLFVELEIIMRC